MALSHNPFGPPEEHDRPQRRAREIRSESDTQRKWATFAQVNEAEEVEFTKEVELLVYPALPLQLRPHDESTRDLVERKWPTAYGVQAEPNRPDVTGNLAGCSLVIAAHPYSRGYFDHCRFLPRYGKPSEADNFILNVLQAGQNWLAEFRGAMEDLGKNPFDSRKGILSALLIDPLRANPRIIWGTEYRAQYWKRTKTTGKLVLKQNALKKSATVWGVVENYDECKNTLLKDPTLSDIVSKTISGEVFEVFRQNPIFREKLLWDETRKATKYDQDQHEDYAKLSRSDAAKAKLEEIAQPMFEHCVELALAGPPLECALDDAVYGFPPTESRQGRQPRRLASTLVLWIYRTLLWNLFERLQKEISRPESDVALKNVSVITPATAELLKPDSEEFFNLMRSLRDQAIEQYEELEAEEQDMAVGELIGDYQKLVPLNTKLVALTSQQADGLFRWCCRVAAAFALGHLNAMLLSLIRQLVQDGVRQEIREAAQFALDSIGTDE